MRRGCFRRIPGRLSGDRGEQIQMPVHVAGERLRDLGFHFAVLLLQFVEGFVLLVHRHELLVGALPFQILPVGVVDLLGAVDQLREALRTPQAHDSGERIAEDIGPVAVLDELAETAFRHLVPENPVGEQRVLFAAEQRHRFGRRVSADRLLVFVRKDPEEFVHPFGGCRLQGLVCNFDHGFRRLIVNMGLFSRVTAALRARRCAGPVS